MGRRKHIMDKSSSFVFNIQGAPFTTCFNFNKNFNFCKNFIESDFLPLWHRICHISCEEYLRWQMTWRGILVLLLNMSLTNTLQLKAKLSHHSQCHVWILLLESPISEKPLLWRHDGRDGVSNYQPHDCWLTRLCSFRRRPKKISKLRATGHSLCARNLPVTGEFPSQMASNAGNVSIWWHHHDMARSKFKKYGKSFWEENRRLRHLVVIIRKNYMCKYNEERCSKQDKKNSGKQFRHLFRQEI